MKKVWLVILIIIIIGVIAGCVYKIVNSNSETKKTENIINETVVNMSTTVNEANKENKINNVSNETESENKVKNEEIENKVENKIDNNVEKNNTIQNTQNTSTEVLTQSPKTNEEKAIKIVKEDWNSEEGVYFSTMGIDSQGRYIVTVNDSNTTGTLAWYAVNVVTGEFEVQ